MKNNNTLIKSMTSKCFIMIIVFNTSVVPSTQQISPHYYSMGVEGQHYSYDEKMDGKKFMEAKSLMWGINGSYTYQPKELGITLEGRYLYGNKEKYWSNGTGTYTKTVPQEILEGRTFIHYDFYTMRNVTFTIGTGLGYRYKMDDAHNVITTTGHRGYKRTNAMIYLPVRLSGNWVLNKTYGVSSALEGDYLIRGTQKSYLSRETDTHKQNKGYGLKGELLLTNKFDFYSISAGPYIHYWKIGDSKKNVKHGGLVWSLEPKNETIEIGVKFKLVV